MYTIFGFTYQKYDRENYTKENKKTLKPFLCDMLWFYDIVSVFYIPTYLYQQGNNDLESLETNR